MKSKIYWGLGIIFFLVIAAVTFKMIKNELELAAIEKLLASFPKMSTKQQSTEVTPNTTETTKVENTSTTTTLDNEPTTNESPKQDNKPTMPTQDNDMISDIPTEPESTGMFPHGFGAYPKVPEGTLIGTFDETQSVQQELLGRVLVKLWNDGDRHVGGWICGETGKVYPNYDDVIYVKYETEFNVLTGEDETKITEATSPPSINPDVLTSLLDGKIPSGYKLIDVDDAGINPYEFLDLSK